MTRRHVDDQALQLATRNALELLGDDPVVPALDEVLVDMVCEGHEVMLGLLAQVQPLLRFRKRQDLLERFFRQSLQVH
jgi:hypothetical protein